MSLRGGSCIQCRRDQVQGRGVRLVSFSIFPVIIAADIWNGRYECKRAVLIWGVWIFKEWWLSVVSIIAFHVLTGNAGVINCIYLFSVSGARISKIIRAWNIALWTREKHLHCGLYFAHYSTLFMTILSQIGTTSQSIDDLVKLWHVVHIFRI